MNASVALKEFKFTEKIIPISLFSLSFGAIYNHCQNCCNKTNINILSTSRATFAYFPPLPLYNVVSLQNVSDSFSIASHNISAHGKPILNRGGGDIKNCEMSYFCGHVTAHFVNDCSMHSFCLPLCV